MTITALMPVYPRCGVRPVRGEGCYLIGERGERYLDFAAGIAVNALGHSNDHFIKKVQDQVATLEQHVAAQDAAQQETQAQLAVARAQAAEAQGAARAAKASVDSQIIALPGAIASEVANQPARPSDHR